MNHPRSRPRILARLGYGSIVWILILTAPLTPGRPAWADPPGATPAPVQARLDWLAALSHPSPALASAAAGPLATNHNFTALADAEVRQGQAAQNFGTSAYVGAGYNADDGLLAYRALFDFGVTGFLPPGTTIHSATLRVYLAGYCYYGNDSVANFQVYRLASAWSEMAVTWNNQPASAEGYGAAAVDDVYATWRSFDVTALVQAWANGTYPEYGLALRGPEASPYGCASREFLSRGGGGYTLAPVLQVNYTLPAPALIAPAPALTFYHQCGIGAPAPAAQVLPIRSNAATLADWTADLTGGLGWASLSATAGKVSSLFPDEIQVTVAEAAPCPGTVTAQIQVSAAGLAGAHTVEVSLVQTEQAVAAVYLPLVTKAAVGAAGVTALASAAGDRYALVVGVADHLYLSPPATFSPFRTGEWGDGDLLQPPGDAVALAQHFTASGYHTTALMEANATRENFAYYFQWVKKRLEPPSGPSVGPQAVAPAEVIIYFSGHGGPLVPDQAPLDEADGDDEFLAVYDTNGSPFTNYILDDFFDAQLATLGTIRVAVLLDACNSGGMEVTQSNHALLAASLENESSWEASELEHGVFTYFMLKALQDPAADTNLDGWLALGEIQAYAQPLITQYLNSKSLTLQTASLKLNSTGDLNIAQLP